MYGPDMIITHEPYSVTEDGFLKALRERIHSVTGSKEAVFG